jgi:putative MATE family efflux protein
MAAGNPIQLQVGTTNKDILKMTLPIALSIMVPQLNFITNNIFLGHYSQQALAAAGITGVYYLIFAVIGNGLNSGLQSLIAHSAGENKLKDVGSLFAQGVRISLILAIIGIVCTYTITPYLLKASVHDTQTVNASIGFLRIRILGLPFLFVYQMRNALLVGTNQSRYLVIGTATEAGVNVLLDYLLIQGRWGLPQMGFNGAALASVIAEVAGLVVIFAVIRYKGISKQLQLFGNWQYHAVHSRKLFTRSLPLMLQFAISIISWEFFYILIEHHGQQDLAISNTMRNIFGFFGCFTWAFASASNAMISNVLGQGLQQQVLPLMYRIMRLSGLFALCVGVLINLFPGLFLSIYGQNNGFVQAAIPVLRIVSVAMLIMTASTTCLNAVTATGNTRINLFVEILAIVLYCVYVYLVLEVWQMPITWGWASEWLYWVTMFIPTYLYMIGGKWKKPSTV